MVRYAISDSLILNSRTFSNGFGAVHSSNRRSSLNIALKYANSKLTKRGVTVFDRVKCLNRDVYTGVIASSLHTSEPQKKPKTTVKRKRRKPVAQKKEPEAKQGDYLIGTDENVLVLSRTYANRANAERAAKMQWERLQRGVATFSIQLARAVRISTRKCR